MGVGRGRRFLTKDDFEDEVEDDYQNDYYQPERADDD